MYKQVIIARKDLNMTPGKLASQVSHASMAFLTAKVKSGLSRVWKKEFMDSFFANMLIADAYNGQKTEYDVHFSLDEETVNEWIRGAFTKTVLEAKNRNQLMKAVETAKEMGLIEGRDYFLIKDNCRTELEPEETDENGVGRTLTCIGFRPMDETVIDRIGKKFQLYH